MHRAALLAAIMTASAVLASMAAPAPVAAACGTAWTSKQEPPQKILVLRTATGSVEKVSLERYVVVVMASGEWPTTMPGALLEAGALATKQYAWYYALKGNHRDSYQTGSGRCYDVRDDSRDQVFRPETAEPTKKQKQARDALWGLSLRKNGKFFLAGYRQGSSTECAADADEWHLYARSAKDCAKRLDYDSEAILRAYYEPKLTFAWAPGTEPEAEDAAEPEAEAETEPEAGDDGESAGAATDEASGLVDTVSSWFGDLFGG